MAIYNLKRLVLVEKESRKTNLSLIDGTHAFKETTACFKRKAIASLGFKETTRCGFFETKRDDSIFNRWHACFLRCGFFGWFQRNHTMRRFQRKHETTACFQRKHETNLSLIFNR